VTGYLGYFVLNAIWRNYYNRPPSSGEEDVILIAVGLSTALYLLGIALAYLSILNVTDYKVRRS
jgi:hypothetical protein